jgi:hypothetical protein
MRVSTGQQKIHQGYSREMARRIEVGGWNSERAGTMNPTIASWK